MNPSQLAVPDDLIDWLADGDRAAELLTDSVLVDQQWWIDHLAEFDMPNTLHGSKIGREDLFALGAVAGESPPDDAIALLWNVVAFCLGRQNADGKKRIAAVAADRKRLGRLLQEAALASRDDPPARRTRCCDRTRAATPSRSSARPGSRGTCTSRGPAIRNIRARYSSQGRPVIAACRLEGPARRRLDRRRLLDLFPDRRPLAHGGRDRSQRRHRARTLRDLAAERMGPSVAGMGTPDLGKGELGTRPPCPPTICASSTLVVHSLRLGAEIR